MRGASRGSSLDRPQKDSHACVSLLVWRLNKKALNHVNSYESLHLYMQSAAEARSYFEDTPGVTVVEIPINDGWARDWGPSVSKQHTLVLVLCIPFSCCTELSKAVLQSGLLCAFVCLAVKVLTVSPHCEDSEGSMQACLLNRRCTFCSSSLNSCLSIMPNL